MFSSTYWSQSSVRHIILLDPLLGLTWPLPIDRRPTGIKPLQVIRDNFQPLYGRIDMTGPSRPASSEVLATQP